MEQGTESKLIDILLYEQQSHSMDLDCISQLSSRGLIEYISEYDWDDVLCNRAVLTEGMFVLSSAVADNPKCDLATALTMFWLSLSIVWDERPREPEEREGEWYRVASNLKENILANRYETGVNVFEGSNYFSDRQKMEWESNGIPVVLYSNVN